VSYCIISGTVSKHEDVSKPSSFQYLCWMSSFISIFYKNSQIKLLFEEREKFNKWKFGRYEEKLKTGTSREGAILDAELTPIEDSDKENSYQEELHAKTTPIENSDKENSYQEWLQELPEEGCMTKFRKAAILVFDL